MSEDPALPPFIYEGLYPARYKTSAIASFADVVRQAANQVRHAVNAGQKPGMPLSVLRNVVRDAPLSSLLIAFLLGLRSARRR
ncbi:hypothetical protein [Bradyrhizobium sp. STM 3809]|uniref:hypothetical protein n=1 Tax=Bradyrhizobium sp. STM 3809 TaxID=551936 RepID=UPI0002407BC6|nr:hypothetical protein [Bradyrhizobium sp. STM 3809]CCD98336.1 hypothetical protein BRAS3809_1780017 [Bradyrhizobium sp. STM 3809]